MGFYSSHIAMSYPATTMKHLDYIERENKFKRLTDLLYKESGNLPDWAKNEVDYWNTVTDYEIKREEDYKNGNVGKLRYAVRKYIFAIPNEMTKEEMIEFTQSFLKENFTDLPYTFVIHQKDSSIHGISNPHVHLLFADYINSERTKSLDRETYFKRHGISKSGNEYGGAARTREYINVSPQKYRQTRKNLADRINAWYESRGIDKRVSEKSLKDQMQESADKGDFLTAETLKREKPFRLSPEKFSKYKRVIQEKVKAGWRNVESLDDIPDPDVRNRILQEFEKQIKEEMAKAIRKQQLEKQPSILDRLRAVENKISEINIIEKYSPSRVNLTSILNREHKEQLEKEREILLLQMTGKEKSNYYFVNSYYVDISEVFQKEHIQRLSDLTDYEKIKEYGISAYTVKEMRKKMNSLIKEKEEIMLLKKLSPQYKAETKKLLRKIESKESLIKYREKIGEPHEDLDKDIAEIRKQIKDITDSQLTKEEREEVAERYKEIQKQIYELRQVSSMYASRIRESGIDEEFRNKYKSEIKEYMKNLERLDKNQVTLKTRKGKQTKEEIINDIVLKRVEDLKELIKNQYKQTYINALEAAREEITNGAYSKLQKQIDEIVMEYQFTSESNYEKRNELQNEYEKIMTQISIIEKNHKNEWEQKVKEIRHQWMKEKNENIEKIKELQTYLIKDQYRKHLNKKIQNIIRGTLRGSDDQITYFEIQNTFNQYELLRINKINDKVNEYGEDLLKQYQENKPRTTEYYIEKEINKITEGKIEKLKNEIEKLKKAQKIILKNNSKNDVSIENESIRNKQAEYKKLIYENLTPEIILKAKKGKDESIKSFDEKRKELIEIRNKVKKNQKRKHLTLKTEKKLKYIEKYTEYTLSRQKMLNNKVAEKVKEFQKKIFDTIPRKENYYIEKIINERNNQILDKKKEEIKAAVQLVEKLKREYPDQKEKIKKLNKIIKEKIKDREEYINSHTTSEIQNMAIKERNEAINNKKQNIKKLKIMYKNIEKNANRKHLPENIKIRYREKLKDLKDILDTVEYSEFEKSAYTPENFIGNIETAMNKLERIAGKTIGRANIRTDQGRD